MFVPKIAAIRTSSKPLFLPENGKHILFQGFYLVFLERVNYMFAQNVIGTLLVQKFILTVLESI